MRLKMLRNAMRTAGLGVLAAGGLAGADPALGHESCSACDPGCQTCQSCSSGSSVRTVEPAPNQPSAVS